jgi:hypothetical protein
VFIVGRILPDPFGIEHGLPLRSELIHETEPKPGDDAGQEYQPSQGPELRHRRKHEPTGRMGNGDHFFVDPRNESATNFA